MPSFGCVVRKVLDKPPEEPLFSWPLFRERYLTRDRMFTVAYLVALFSICLYNLVVILKIFFKHDTNISLSNQSPNVTNFPGITVCAPAIFTPKALASKKSELSNGHSSN